MANKFDPSAFVDGVTNLTAQNCKDVAFDIQVRGSNLDGAGYGYPNSGFITLLPGATPGTSYTVSSGSWSGGVALLGIGVHTILPGQRVGISAVNPAGYNGVVIVTAVTGTQISYALTGNPGAYVSGGTVLVDNVASPAVGMLCVDAAVNLKMWNGSAFVTISSGAALSDPGSNGIVKRTALNITTAAVAGTDYAVPTSGNAILKGNGAGGFASAAAGTDYAPATSGAAVLKGNGAGGFSAATSGSDYAPATSGSSVLKGNGAGGFSAAAAGTDYAPATSGSSVLKGNGAGGFSAAAAADLPVFGASGGSHSAGAVPDPGAGAGTTRFLREDATFAVPAAGGSGSPAFSALSYSNSWGDFGLPNPTGGYAKDLGRLILKGWIKPGTTSGAWQTIGTVPSGYFPTTETRYAPISGFVTGSGGALASVALRLDTSGNLQIYNSAGLGTLFIIDCQIPLF